jgi:circadian clock protein KaiA
LSSQVSISILASSQALGREIIHLISGDRFVANLFDLRENFYDSIETNKEQIDCLIFVKDVSLASLLDRLCSQGILLPAIFINLETQERKKIEEESEPEKSTYEYHTAEIQLSLNELSQINAYIEQAIAQFLSLGPSCPIAPKSNKLTNPIPDSTNNFLLLQQRRLAEKLKERLGYLGVYYKRNSKDFYRNLSPDNKEELLKELSEQYKQIIINYFAEDIENNQLIDRFVNQTFFADLSVSQILEMHMELMDEFAQQLKIERRSEEILLDYRLALIDIIAHLCEMYRRSIPREDLPLDILFRLD